MAIQPCLIAGVRREAREAGRKTAGVFADFAAGLVFGLHGTIERVTQKVFLLSPVNVDVGDEARAQIAKDGFFNQS